MAASRPVNIVRVRAFAKINLSLRVTGVRADGYHTLDTTFQSLALHDTITISARPGPMRLFCSDPACPGGEDNLVWRAAARVWSAAHRSGAPHGVAIRIRKRIPTEAGLGGGSSDGAAALRAFARFWRVKLSSRKIEAIARALGADVPYFLTGGTARGLGRGDRLRPLPDAPRAWVVLAIPRFGVSTRQAFDWWDRARRRASGREHEVRSAREASASGGGAPRESQECRDILNDLERVVAAKQPEIARLVRALTRLGARQAAMSGSGSAVFGLFDTRRAAVRAARALAGRPGARIVTRTLDRGRYEELGAPHLPR